MNRSVRTGISLLIPPIMCCVYGAFGTSCHPPGSLTDAVGEITELQVYRGAAWEVGEALSLSGLVLHFPQVGQRRRPSGQPAWDSGLFYGDDDRARIQRPVRHFERLKKGQECLITLYCFRRILPGSHTFHIWEKQRKIYSFRPWKTFASRLTNKSVTDWIWLCSLSRFVEMKSVAGIILGWLQMIWLQLFFPGAAGWCPLIL